VQQDDDGADALAPAQLARVAVDRLGLVQELETLDARGRDDVGRPLERQADEADLGALEPADRVGREDRLAGGLLDHVGGEVAEVRAREAVLLLSASAPSKQPSVGWQPPDCIRWSSVQPSSNSWLPTALMSRPRAFIASIVGSSWNSAEVSGLAPIRSPADTVSVLRFRRWYSRREVARYAAPPAGMPAASVLSTLIVPGVVGSRFPWKSLSASSWSLTRPRDRTVT